MSKNNLSNVYDDDNIPEVDLPRDNTNNHSTNSMSNSTSDCATDGMSNDKNNCNTNCSNHKVNTTSKPNYNVEPLPESSRPRKDGPGGA